MRADGPHRQEATARPSVASIAVRARPFGGRRRKLSNAGVRVTSNRYNGTIHDFVMLNALADTPAARGAIAQAVCALKTTIG